MQTSNFFGDEIMIIGSSPCNIEQLFTSGLESLSDELEHLRRLLTRDDSLDHGAVD